MANMNGNMTCSKRRKINLLQLILFIRQFENPELLNWHFYQSNFTSLWDVRLGKETHKEEAIYVTPQ